MQTTSLEAYNKIKAQGLLPPRRFEVYQVLALYGAQTQSEVFAQLGLIGEKRVCYTPRFAELEKQGVIKIVGERACGITGKNCKLWDVTHDLPKPIRIARKIMSEQNFDDFVLFMRDIGVPYIYFNKISEYIKEGKR